MYVIPAFIARLELLQVLLINNNRLVSLPEDIGQLRQLMQLVCRIYSFTVGTEVWQLE